MKTVYLRFGRGAKGVEVEVYIALGSKVGTLSQTPRINPSPVTS